MIDPNFTVRQGEALDKLIPAINKVERLISEAIRTGCGRGEEYVLAAHRALIETGVVLGYTAKDQSSDCK